MSIKAIPRHQIETTLGDYGRMLLALAGRGRRSSHEATRTFEEQFARFVGCRNAIAVSSGRLGLRVGLRQLNFPEGSEVIIPSFNLFAVVEEFVALGIKPVFVDVSPEDLNINVRRLEERVIPNTRAIVATHMFGQPCEMDVITQFARRHNLVLIEDCAHAFGSRYHGRCVGTFGKFSIFSLSVLKLITTFGGGVITTEDNELAASIREDLVSSSTSCGFIESGKRFLKGVMLDVGTRTLPFTLGGWPALRMARAVKPDIQQKIMTPTPRRTASAKPGGTPQLACFQAVLGQSQLAQAYNLIARRQAIMRWLDEALADVPRIRLLKRNAHTDHNGLYYGILTDDAEALAKFLFAHGVDSETAEYRNCADLEIYREFHRDCPGAREVQQSILRLPCHPSLTRRDVERIAHVIKRFGRERAGQTVTKPWSAVEHRSNRSGEKLDSRWPADVC